MTCIHPGKPYTLQRLHLTVSQAITSFFLCLSLGSLCHQILFYASQDGVSISYTGEQLCQDKIYGILTALLCSKEVHSTGWVLPTMHCLSSSCGVKWINLLLWGKLLKQTAGIASSLRFHSPTSGSLLPLPPRNLLLLLPIAPLTPLCPTQPTAPAKIYVLLFAEAHSSAKKLNTCKLS